MHAYLHEKALTVVRGNSTNVANKLLISITMMNEFVGSLSSLFFKKLHITDEFKGILIKITIIHIIPYIW